MPYRSPGRPREVIRRYEPTAQEVEDALRRYLQEMKRIPLNKDSILIIKWVVGSQVVEGTAHPQIEWDDEDFDGRSIR